MAFSFPKPPEPPKLPQGVNYGNTQQGGSFTRTLPDDYKNYYQKEGQYNLPPGLIKFKHRVGGDPHSFYNAETAAGQAYTFENIPGLIDEQIKGAGEAQAATIGAKQSGIDYLDGLMKSIMGAGNADVDRTRADIMKSYGEDDAFANRLKSSISGTLANPEVFGQNDLDALDAMLRDRTTASMSEARQGLNYNNAARGVGNSGVNDRQQIQLQTDALRENLQNLSGIQFQAKQAEADNLARAQGEGVNLQGVLGQENASLGSLLAQLSGQNVGYADIGARLGGQAGGIYNDMEFDAPDYSGIASLIMQKVGQEQAAEQARRLKKSADRNSIIGAIGSIGGGLTGGLTSLLG